MTNASKKKIQQAVQVAKYYYQSNLDQSEIAKEMSLSRPTVSRLLQFSKDEGYVQISIMDPYNDSKQLEEQLQEKYGLKKVIIAYSHSTNEGNILQNIGQKAAEYIQDIAENDAIIGIGFGKTMYAVAKELNEFPLENTKIVQLKGGESHASVTNYSHEVMSLFTQAFHAKSEILPLPVIFEQQETKELVMSESHIKYLMDEGRKANVAIFTVGSVENNAMLFQLNYFDDQEVTAIQSTAVGDILSRFITVDGSIANEEINNRTIGIELSELKDKNDTILVAGGKHKVAPIHAALVGGLANTLVTDIHTATKLIERQK